MSTIQNRETIRFNLPSLFTRITDINTNTNKHINWNTMHLHDSIEIVRVNSGKINCSVAGKIAVLEKGSIILINCRVIHRIFPGKYVDITIIQSETEKYTDTDTSFSQNFSEFISRNKRAPYIICHCGSELWEIADSLIRESREKQKGYEKYIKAGIYRLCAFMERNGLSESEDISETDKLRKIQPAVEYIDENFRDRLSLNDIAQRCNMSRFELCRAFKNLSGTTVFDYVTFVRLRHAIRLIKNKDHSISDAAFECGFCSVQYFNRVFKANLGCAPSEMRKSGI